MALKVFDGFDHYNAQADFFARASNFLQWQTILFQAANVAFNTGRDGFGKCVNLSIVTTSTVGVLASWGARNQEAYFGFAELVPNGNSFSVNLFDGVAGNIQCLILFNGNNYSIQFFRYNGAGAPISLYISPNNVWSPEVWNFIEVHGKIDTSAGILEVRVRNQVVASASGLNNQYTANAWFDGTQFTVTPLSGFDSLSIDDLYYCDTTTGPGLTPCNTYLGDVAVKTLFATGNDSVQFTPLTGSNWSEINETAMDSDTSYNYSTTATNQDTFTFQPLEATITTVFGVQLTFAARKDDALARMIKPIVKISGTSYAGTTYSIPDTNYAYFTYLWVLNPATALNWILSDVNGADYGYNLVS